MNANVLRYETLGISELLHYQNIMNFDARTEVRITASTPMFYDRVLPTVFIISQHLALLSSQSLVSISLD
jgi:hypothetical protein